ncbi:MAG: 1-deoxy-D-xylulose-5-phosphate synthase [Candidatus Cloacimonetes bacterium]|nr:1-deoxy-D-xylulose-5-phosphate synthase [Candidatus Cloacimonadota bacterium]
MILEKISHPSQIREYGPEELKMLASETRKRILDVASKTGGHVAPSLGAVDFTISLLNVFDLTQDKVVWDVGHQAYAWKILTGRNDRFDTIRSLGGLSGFTNRDESEFDAFTTGHSSTSISAALGIACGRDHKQEAGHVIAVIGDGALTGGMSFEAMNHAGHLQKNKFIVILNDNAMSISSNVGGLQKYMARMMASKSYNSLKKQIWDLSHTLPSSIRRRFIYGAQKLEESMLNILVPNIIFEDLGFKYLGPIDGHDIGMVSSILRRARDNMIGPVLIHLVTQKGKGYSPAERNSSLFHGIGPFESKSGKPVCTGGESWSEVFGSTLVNLAKKNEKIIAITAAMSAGTGLSGFEKRYPKRFYDVGIAEQHAITFAAGLSTKGLKPFVAIYSTFMQRALDQLIHDVALPRLPVVFCIDRAGLVGEDGATHHGAFDVSLLNFVPNLTIIAPYSAEELASALKWASEYSLGPIAIRYPRGNAFCEGKDGGSFTPGIAKQVSTGEKIALISCGDTYQLVTSLREKMVTEGLNPIHLHFSTLKPLDEKALELMAKNSKMCFTFETNSTVGGFGSRVSQFFGRSKLKVVNFGYPEKFIAHGKICELNEQIGFTPEKLWERIKELL